MWRLELRDYSLFELHSSQPTAIRCQCGYALVEIDGTAVYTD